MRDSAAHQCSLQDCRGSLTTPCSQEQARPDSGIGFLVNLLKTLSCSLSPTLFSCSHGALHPQASSLNPPPSTLYPKHSSLNPQAGGAARPLGTARGRCPGDRIYLTESMFVFGKSQFPHRSVYLFFIIANVSSRTNPSTHPSSLII